MENKKDLAKIALTALILAAASPVALQAGVEMEGVMLAHGGGCQMHGCAVPDHPGNDGPHGCSSPNNGYEKPDRDGNVPYGYQNRYNYSAGQTSAPRQNPNPTAYNHDYNSYHQNDYNQIATATGASHATLTEAQLLGTLNPKGKAIYHSLDADGKAYALKLANQGTHGDNNQALEEAQRQMIERLNAKQQPRR